MIQNTVSSKLSDNVKRLLAQLKIETGRYERKELNERLCINCDNLEDEKHVLLKCPLYEDLRQSMFIRSVAYGESEVKLFACKEIANRW
jgi:hypothetical protein